MRLNKTGKTVLVLLVLICLYAWIDGGREQPRLIRQPVVLSGAAK
ncbi:MAG: hypothetical protein ABIP41_04050 [Croceibacterium sp.]